MEGHGFHGISRQPCQTTIQSLQSIEINMQRAGAGIGLLHNLASRNMRQMSYVDMAHVVMVFVRIIWRDT